MLIKLLLCIDCFSNKHIFIYHDWKNVDKMIRTMKNLHSNHVYGAEEATDEVRKYYGTF